ncbi:TRAP transporter substrate-binding protein DctP [Aliamphritea spongicola]|uniref:TRAP transporter substrate-binding protein DctP n=1 Tax=Aliamphritea spongicola TaxID=707589 RepID=UPI00196A5E2D|nr:TRAP transporter substrate-binding protein DctP [Aliamphritea spongicola]MBN3562732.1 TRAP transporter substrate-binding protein DctP [Aliamphritea spongicola]
MTIKTTIKSLVAACTTATVLSLPMATQANAGDDFILAHAYPADHIFHMASETFIEEMKSNNSELEVSYHPGGDLGDWASIFEQSMEGVVPMTMSFGASEYDPRLDLSWLAYVVDNWDDARKVYGPNGQMTDVYNEILGDLDLEILGTIPTGFGSLAVRKGVNRVPTSFLEDAQGFKMRVPPAPVAIERFKNWGFTAVPMPFAELYTALQLGTVDGRAFGPSVEIWQMRDVLESYVLTKDYFEHAFWVVNKSWMDSLPEAEQKKIRDAAEVTMTKVWAEAQSIDEGFLAKVQENGINVVELSPAELKKAKSIIYEKEWPFMEEIVGTEIMNKMRAIAGIN